jgi:hypothetical protein
MYAINGANSTFHNICRWYITLNAAKIVELYIDRPVDSYEDIVIKAYNNITLASLTLTNKDLLD